MSSIVVINGLAITAGSSRHFFAINGSDAPTNLASKMVTNIEREIIKADIKKRQRERAIKRSKGEF